MEQETVVGELAGDETVADEMSEETDDLVAGEAWLVDYLIERQGIGRGIEGRHEPLLVLTVLE